MALYDTEDKEWVTRLQVHLEHQESGQEAVRAFSQYWPLVLSVCNGAVSYPNLLVFFHSFTLISVQPDRPPSNMVAASSALFTSISPHCGSAPKEAGRQLERGIYEW